jgi:hypothetical protein
VGKTIIKIDQWEGKQSTPCVGYTSHNIPLRAQEMLGFITSTAFQR